MAHLIDDEAGQENDGVSRYVPYQPRRVVRRSSADARCSGDDEDDDDDGSGTSGSDSGSGERSSQRSNTQPRPPPRSQSPAPRGRLGDVARRHELLAQRCDEGDADERAARRQARLVDQQRGQATWEVPEQQPFNRDKYHVLPPQPQRQQQEQEQQKPPPSSQRSQSRQPSQHAAARSDDGDDDGPRADQTWPVPSLAAVEDVKHAHVCNPTHSALDLCTLDDIIAQVHDMHRRTRGAHLRDAPDPRALTAMADEFFSADPLPDQIVTAAIHLAHVGWVNEYTLALRRLGAAADRMTDAEAALVFLEEALVTLTLLYDFVRTRAGAMRALYTDTNLRSTLPLVLDFPGSMGLDRILPEGRRQLYDFGLFAFRDASRKSINNLVMMPQRVRHQGRMVYTGVYVPLEDPTTRAAMHLDAYVAAWAAQTGINGCGMADNAIKRVREAYREMHLPPLLPWLPDRSVFAFPHADGRIWYVVNRPNVWDGDKCEFSVTVADDPKVSNLTPCMYFDGPELTDTIARSVAQSPLFPGDVDPRDGPDAVPPDGHYADFNYDDYFLDAIPTPVLDQVLDWQLYLRAPDGQDRHAFICGEENEAAAAAAGLPDWRHRFVIKLTVLAFMGRWALETNKYDDWQLMLIFMGSGGTGKTLLMEHMMKQWFPSQFIGTLSATMEKQFGLTDMDKKWGIIADEMRGWIGLDASNLLRMISGQSLPISQKNKDPRVVDEFRAQIVFGGNAWPTNLDDVEGSMKRRSVFVSMDRPVPPDQAMDNMTSAAKAEAGAALLKCIAAYRALRQWLLRRHQKRDVRPFMDAYFAEQASKWLNSANVFDEFLRRGPFVFDLGGEASAERRIYMPLDVVRRLFYEHCERTGIRSPPRWCDALFRAPFQQRRVEISMGHESRLPAEETRQWPVMRDGNGPRVRGVYAIGIDIHYDTTVANFPVLADVYKGDIKRRDDVYAADVAGRFAQTVANKVNETDLYMARLRLKTIGNAERGGGARQRKRKDAPAAASD